MYIPSPQPDGTVILSVIGDSLTGYKRVKTDADRDKLISQAADSACDDGYDLIGPVTSSLGDGVLGAGLYTRYHVQIRCRPLTESAANKQPSGA
jgi:hypothetical protein